MEKAVVVTKITVKGNTPAEKEKEVSPSEKEPKVRKWSEHQIVGDGPIWQQMSHYGPAFPPPYVRVPTDVKFQYSGKPMRLSDEAEEMAGFYGGMLDNENTSKDLFQRNFFKDWRAVMTDKERGIIKDFKKCNFQEFYKYYNMKAGQRELTMKQKLRLRREKEDLTEKYGYCIIDGHKQKISSFKIQPPGLFIGLHNHPKMGKLRKRIEAEDVVINIGKEDKVPPPPFGHMWKEVRHDNTVSWLAKWTENIFSSTKYMELSLSYKGEKDCQIFETARELKAHIDSIRAEYTRDFKSDDMQVRQRAVALYFIDKLALGAGNEEDEDTADTVGCCSLRVEHISLDEVKDGKKWVVNFDFLGKDSIRYVNSVAVVEEVFNNLRFFMEKKKPGIDLFDKLTTSFLNKYLNDLMEGLTAKVFRTYNASQTLEDELIRLTKYYMSVSQRVSVYDRAKANVGLLCNIQQTFFESFNKNMVTLETKMNALMLQITELDKEVKAAQKGLIQVPEQRKKQQQLAQLQQQLKEQKIQAHAKQEMKKNIEETSKLNYLDPRISVAWCKRWEVPVREIYNISQRDKFKWAIKMASPDFWF